jgi:hypothetical protein
MKLYGDVFGCRSLRTSRGLVPAARRWSWDGVVILVSHPTSSTFSQRPVDGAIHEVNAMRLTQIDGPVVSVGVLRKEVLGCRSLRT